MRDSSVRLNKRRRLTLTPTPEEFLDDMVRAWDHRATVLPYQRAIIDAVLNPVTYQVTCLMAAQTGKTTTLAAVCLFYCQFRSADILLAVPRDDDKDVFRAQKLNPFIRRADGWGPEVLEARKGHIVNRDQLDTPFGTTIWFGHSGSPPSIQGKTVQVTVADEVDRFQTKGHDGHPLDLMRDRASTYERTGEALHVISSTPAQIADSRTVDAFNRSSREFWHAYCLEAKEYYRQDFYKHFIGGVLYCECGERLEEDKRRSQIMQGLFVAENPDNVRERGFRLSRLDSLLVDAQSTWDEFGKRSRASFDAQVLALPSGEATRDEDFDADDIARAYVDAHPWPDSVDTRTMGVDVQKRWLECLVLDHSRDKFHIVDHARVRRLADETHKELVKRTLDMMADRWNPDLTFIDLGYEDIEVSEGVYASRHGQNFWEREESDVSYTLRKAAGVRSVAEVERVVSGKYAIGRFRCDSWRIGGGVCKTDLSNLFAEGRVTAERPHMPSDFITQLTSEVNRPHGATGRMVWEKRTPGATNDVLDALVYAYAAVWYHQPQGTQDWIREGHQASYEAFLRDRGSSD